MTEKYTLTYYRTEDPITHRYVTSDYLKLAYAISIVKEQGYKVLGISGVKVGV